MELTAERELDVRIAREWMGWVWATFNPEHFPSLSGRRILVPPDSQDAKQRPCGEDVPLDELWYFSVPEYSTDRAAVWDVMDKMRIPSVARDNAGRWRCCHWVKGVGHVRGSGETAQLAICRAALNMDAPHD